jgi:hypothetical protein
LFAQGVASLSQPEVKDESLIDIPIEQALYSADQMQLQDFILMAQRMQFKVSFHFVG